MNLFNRSKLTRDQLVLFSATKAIYHAEYITLAGRLDIAWEVYKSDDKKVTKGMKKNALQFLLYALNLEAGASAKTLNNQLISLMNDRKKYKQNNPDYIPGREALHLPFNSAKLVPKKTEQHGKAQNKGVRAAIDSQELLDVNNASKFEDNELSIQHYDRKKRALHHVVIHNGEFKQYGERFSTEKMISHNKAGFGAYTLNSNGELSVFNHNGEEGRIAHSTMNAGAPVIASGELEIKDGKLLSITTHSGHYRPTLFNVYRTLEYLDQQGIDVSNVKVITQLDPSEIFPERKIAEDEVFKNAYNFTLYEVPAIKIYNRVAELLNQSIASIREQLDNYNNSRVSRFNTVKNRFFSSGLSKLRHELAVELDSAAAQFQREISGNPSLSHVMQAKETFQTKLERIEEKNKQLSREHGKSESNGRLHEQIQRYKKQMNAALTSDATDVEIDSEKASNYKNLC